MTSRRGFLAGLLAAGATPRLTWADAGAPAWIAAAQEPDGAFALYGLRQNGTAGFRVPLPARGHAGAGHPSRPVAVAFARRPGHFALVIDCARGTVLRALAPPEGRQFNGHGVFLQGGAVLATVEQVAKDSAGRIGLWDAATWARMGEWDTRGIGPHDLRLMPDGVTLVVANGGIATDPTDRTKLNIPDMQPSLVFLGADGAEVARAEPAPAMRQASMRHLAVRGDGLVACAMQWEGDPSHAVPLLALVRQGGAPVLATLPETEAPLMNGYAGSVAWAGDGATVAITSPRGGRVQRFDASGAFVDAMARADVCGVAPRDGALMTSDGGGAIIALNADGPRLLARHPVAWDNHIVTL